jgi:hypothetical protein
MIEAYLRSFINYEIDNWVGLLPMAEFAYNNSITQASGMPPFYANYGSYPGSMNPASIPNTKGDNMAYIHHLLSMQEMLKKNLKTTQERMKKYADLK